MHKYPPLLKHLPLLLGNSSYNLTDSRKTVYLCKQDILENKRVISRNCTEGESLTKRNDAVKAAIEAKRLDGLSRYAREYQEKQGYFEEAMQLVYHYGGMDAKNPEEQKISQGRRRKRAHGGNDTDVSNRPFFFLKLFLFSMILLFFYIFFFSSYLFDRDLCDSSMNIFFFFIYFQG